MRSQNTATPEELIPASKGHKVAVTAAALAIFLVLAWLLLSAVTNPRTFSRQHSCNNNLRTIGLALTQYHDTIGCFPPATINDASGKPMHSWRVLLLPYLDQKALYDRYRFDEPWDGPNNRKLHNEVMKCYCCPADGGSRSSTQTSYLAVQGGHTIWLGDYTRMADLLDGSSNTVMLVETANSGIHWMEPRDLRADELPMAIHPGQSQGISSQHPGGAHVLFADCHVQFVHNGILPEKLKRSFAFKRSLRSGSGGTP